jgi:GT2 family glycosyltransferase
VSGDAGGAALARLVDRRFETKHPLVSVIIPVFNNWAVTRRCLESLVRCDPEIAVQAIVVDDASTDDTLGQLAALRKIEVLRNGENAGFVKSCNRAALLARGDYLWFLNNDTEVTTGSLRALVQRAERDLTIAIVGSKLVYPDGRLQEAGGIIWADAGGWNYGRLDSPAMPEYNFVRDVDYVSGASLLVRTQLFRELGGFDERFAPAYYEDADLCFQVRARGHRVVYEPRSVVTHYEGLSSGTDLGSGMKRFQVVNQAKFFSKWEPVLTAQHSPPSAAGVRMAARARGGRRGGILVIDSYVPMYDREAGSKRLRELIDGFVASGERVVFLPDNIAALEPYSGELQAEGVELLYYSEGDPRRSKELLLDALPTVDAVWICRPELCRKYLPLIRGHSNLPILYDTIDLHHLRLRRQAELEGRDDSEWRRVEELELTCGRASDATIVVTESEAAVFREAGVAPVAIVPTIHDVLLESHPPFDATQGLLFIGGYNHTPNVDAVKWLVSQVMPIVWKRAGDVHVTLLGANPPAEVLALAGRRVSVPGYVRDVEPFFLGARVFVAPIRYGAGVKGKIGHALSYRVPVVTTPLAADGFHLNHGSEALIAQSAEDFAAAIVSLYTDAELWNSVSAQCSRPLETFSSRRVVADALEIIDRVRRTRGTLAPARA